MDYDSIKKLEVLANVPLVSRRAPYTRLYRARHLSPHRSSERWGQDDTIHSHVRKYALLVALAWCPEIIRFNYRRFRTWMTGRTAVAGGAELQPRIRKTHLLTKHVV